MSKLSDKEYWNAVHAFEEERFDSDVSKTRMDHAQPTLKRRLVLRVKRLLGPNVLERMTSYRDYLLWEVIFKRHLPQLTGAKVLEIGSAPGEFLTEFGRRYECIPYGVEYSDVGVQVNRKVFSSQRFNPDNVIHDDFFADHFHEKYRESFDVVISRGFIEHFTDVGGVIERHMDLLAEGGYLIVSVPNFRGINYLVTRVFNKELIPLHNLDIMRKAEFAVLFERPDLSRLFCNYYGTFSFNLFHAKAGSPLHLAHKVQPVLNLLFRLVLRDNGAESQMLSPQLLFIGRKTSKR